MPGTGIDHNGRRRFKPGCNDSERCFERQRVAVHSGARGEPKKREKNIPRETGRLGPGKYLFEPWLRFPVHWRFLIDCVNQKIGVD